jgi:mRNA (2'-O-methyladenosine-N6-)-methyltransferase
LTDDGGHSSRRYDLLERLVPGGRKLELFGRPHNAHRGWTTLGNQLGRMQCSEPWLRQRLLEEGVVAESDLAPLPPPPDDPIVPPWGGHPPPPPLAPPLKLAHEL